MLINLIIAIASSTQIQEGLSYSGNLSTSKNPNLTLSYLYTSSLNSDLSILTTVFSDISDVQIYFSNDTNLSIFNWQYSSKFRNSGTLQIPHEFLIQNSTYFILLICDRSCMFSISLSTTIPLTLYNGIPIAGSLDKSKRLSFLFDSSDKQNFTFISVKLSGTADVSVLNPQNLTQELKLNKVWPDQLEYLSVDKGGKYLVIITAEEFTKFIITGIYSQTAPILLQASTPVSSHSRCNENKMYFIEVMDSFDQIEFSLTVFSGNADLFIGFSDEVNKEVYSFSSESPGSEFIVVGMDELIKHNFLAGKIFAAVYGVEDSAFTFVARTIKNSSLRLMDGISQEFMMSKDEILNFYFEVGLKPLNISFYLTNYKGKADIYVKFCESHCIINEDYLENDTLIKGLGYSVSQSLNFHYFSNIKCNSTSLCNLAILVHSKAKSHCSLVAAKANSNISLVEGKGFLFNTQFGSNQNFAYSLISKTVFELEFILTPIYGSPNFCINKGLSDFEYCEKSSIQSKINVDRINYTINEKNISLEGLRIITVTCKSSCFYSILAREIYIKKNISSNLISGVPQSDVLFNKPDKNFRVYKFEVNSEKSDLEIIFLSYTGKKSVYIANNPLSLEGINENFSFDWEFYDESYIRLSWNDPKFIVNTTYLIVVQAHQFLGEESNTFTIQVGRKNDEFLLVNDFNLPGQIRNNENADYIFPIQMLNQDIKISLTTISGDPDLFISFISKNSQNNNSIRSNSFGSETLILLWDDQISKYCPELRYQNEYNNSSSCFMHISLYSEYTSTYKIKVSAQTNLPQYIENGGVIHGSLKKNEFEFFYTYIDVSQSLSVLLHNFVGDSQMFVSIFDKNEASIKIEDWKRPNEKNSLRKVKNLVIEIIQLTDLELKGYCESVCLIIISVECSKEVCEFSLQNIEDDIIKLSESKAYYGAVGLDYQYYQYICDKVDKFLIVTLTPIESCEPILYISKGKDKRPTDVLFDWTSESSSGNFIKIASNDPKFMVNSMIGTYTIAVTSFYTSCSYTITVTNHEIPIVVLTPGLPQEDTISNEGIRYYTLFNTLAEHLVFSITPTIGSPYLILSVHQDDGSQFYSNLPSTDNYIWNSNSAKDKYTLSVSSNDVNFCLKCYYLLGVVSNYLSVYSITGTTELNFKVLQNGIPQKAEINLKTWHLYTFNVNYKQKLQVSVTEYSNTVEFLAGISENPNEFKWRAIVGTRTKKIVILPNDTNFIMGTYYVFLSTDVPDSIYTIVWSSENTDIKLIDGWPLMYNLGLESDNKIKFKFEQPGSVFCMIESLTEKYFPLVDTFIKEKNSTGLIPYYKYNETNYNSEHLSMDFLVNTSNYLILEVKNPSFSNTITNEFSLYCTKSFHPAFIKVGTTVIGHLNSEKPALRYEINLSTKKTLKMYVVPCEGAVELKASTNWTEIKEKDPFFTVIKLTNGVIIGKISNVIGKVYLTIKKFDFLKTSTYKLFVDDQMLEQVYPGNSGFLFWEYYKSKINIQWKGLEYSNSSRYVGKVTYYIFFTKDIFVPLTSTCQVYFAVSQGAGKWIGSTFRESFLADIKESGYLTVVGRIESKDVVPLRDVIYNKIRVEGIKSERKFGKVLLVLLMISILFLIVITLVVLKFRRVKKEINSVENHEKNVTNINESQINEFTKNEN